MAMERCPEHLQYLKALEEYNNESDPEKKLSLREKIRFPWGPRELHYLSLSTGIPESDETKKELLDRFESAAVVLLSEFNDDIEAYRGQYPWGQKGPVNVRATGGWTFTEGRLVVRLSIDLNKSDKELKKHFIEIVKNAKEAMYEGQVVKQGVLEGRARKPSYNPWGIYDLCKEGLSLPAIARKLYIEQYGPPAKRSRRLNPDMDGIHQAVKRAYDKAATMIQVVSKEAKIRSFQKNRS